MASKRAVQRILDKHRCIFDGKSGVLRKRTGNSCWSARFYRHGKKIEVGTRTGDKQKAIEFLKKCLADTCAAEAAGDITHFHPAAVRDLTTANTASNIGCAAEMLVCVDLMNRGFPVFRAVSPNSPADLIALIDGKAIMVEVKVGRINGKGNPKVGCIRKTCRYDVLAVLSRGEGIKYLPPLNAFHCASTAGAKV
jgi:hypothetical protein